jgi:hypothetical protein
MFRKVIPSNRHSTQAVLVVCLLLSLLAAAPAPAPSKKPVLVPASPSVSAPTDSAPAVISVIPTTVARPKSATHSINTSLLALDAALDVTPIPTTTRLPILEYHYSTFHMDDDVMMTTEWFES